MDMAMLRRVAKEGLSPHRKHLSSLVAFCDDWGRETGDARYLVLRDLFAEIENWWGEEQGVLLSLVAQVDAALKRTLSDVLTEAASDASRLAAALADEIRPLLVPTWAWVRESQETGR